MSVQKRSTNAGKAVWEVRWGESGRGSKHRRRSFERNRDAQAFEAK